MIARVWKAIATSDHVADYQHHFEHSVSPELKTIEGFQGAYILTRDLNGNIEISVMTLWESMAAIHKFAGENVEVAVVEPAAQAVLESFDKTVLHYEVVLNSPPRIK
jgi:heme-degrading monooxygenase HmoA